MSYQGGVKFEIDDGKLTLGDVTIHDIKRAQIDRDGDCLIFESRCGANIWINFESPEALAIAVSNLAAEVSERAAAKALVNHAERAVKLAGIQVS